MLDRNQVFETISMIEEQHLDVRTVTLGLSLYDCITDSADAVCRKVYEKLMRAAEDLVPTAERISKELGVPIVNKRISVTPISVVGASSLAYVPLCRTLDRAAKELGVDFIGGYSALVHKGIAPFEQEFLRSIPEALATTDRVCSSVSVGSTRAGLNMDAVRTCGGLIKEMAALTADRDGFACAKFVVFANPVEDNPFMAGAFLGAGEGDSVINVGVSGPGVVKCALERLGKEADLTAVAEEIKKTAFKITRVGQLVAQRAAKYMNASFGIVDLSLAPTPVMGDSVAHILEEIGLSRTGSAGTTACLAMLNDAVKKGGVMASSHVGGLSGAFIPVSEDAGMIRACREGALSIERLEAMTAVCSVGLDMIAVPGDTPAEVLSAIIADEASIGIVNNKTTAVRIIPVPGKDVGEEVRFGGLLGEAPIIPVSKQSPAVFINRGGRIPAPIHSNKN